MLEGIRTSPDKAQSDIYPLKIIDPTLMDSKEHIILTIIMLIKNAVSKVLKKSGDNEQESIWKNSLSKLAKGLCMLDGIGRENFKTELWDNYQVILEDGLDETESCFNLERNLHSFISKSLKILNQKAFILAFDDIDTNFESGLPVLEALRKYITTPQVIIILSGDLELYSKLIRKKHFENFSDKFIAFEGQSKTEDKTHQIIDRLEEQYVLKILQPANRITLKTTQECLQENNKIIITHPNGTENSAKDLSQIIDTICKDLLYLNTTETQKIARNIILNCPIRTTLNAIRGLSECYDGNWTLKSNVSANIKTTNRTLASTYITSLLKYGYNTSDLSEIASISIHEKLISTSHELGRLENIYPLIPNSTNQYTGQALLTLSAYHSSAIHLNPALYFSYLTKICLTQFITQTITKKSQGNQQDTQLAYIPYAKLDHISTTKDVACKATAFLRSPTYTHAERKLEKKPLSFGTTCTYTESMAGRLPADWMEKVYSNNKNKFHNTKATNPNEIFTTPENLYNDVERFGILLPIVSINRFTRESTPVASIFKIIGAIADVLSENSNPAIAKLLVNLDKMQEVTLPENFDLEENVLFDKSEVEQKNKGNSYNNHISALSIDIIAWKSEFIKTWENNPIPVSIIAKIWDRFCSTLIRMDEEFSSMDSLIKVPLGDMLHRQMIAFCNSMLVEEFLYNTQSSSAQSTTTQPDLRNAVTDDRFFDINLSKALTAGYCKSTIALIKCPLINIYLKQESKLFNNSNIYANPENHLSTYNVNKDMNRLLYQINEQFDRKPSGSKSKPKDKKPPQDETISKN